MVMAGPQTGTTIETDVAPFTVGTLINPKVIEAIIQRLDH